MSTFSSLRVRNYRLFAGGQVVSLSGTWAQRVAQDWLVLDLSHDSGLALGITTGLQFLPMVLFGLYGGLLADRYDKRRLLIGAQAVMGVLALVLGLLDLAGVVQLWHVFVLAFLLGLASVIDTPVRQSFVVEMVGSEDLPNAVGLNSATFNSARIIGPAVAGVAISGVGTAWVFLANAVSFVAVIAGLLAMRPAELHPAPPIRKGRGQVREGLDYVRAHPELAVPIILVGLVEMFGINFQVTLALVAKEVFHRGAGSYGALSACLAAGSLVGALGSARREGPRQVLLYGSGIVFGLLEVLVGLAPTYAVMCGVLVLTGAAVLTFTTTCNATVQLGAAPQVRGRVMSLYILVFLGGTPIGAPIIGAMAERYGARSTMWVGGAVTLLCSVVAGWWMVRHQRLRMSGTLWPRPRLVFTPVSGDVVEEPVLSKV